MSLKKQLQRCFQGVPLTGNSDSLVSDGVCEQHAALLASFTCHTSNCPRVHVVEVLQSNSQDLWIVVLASPKSHECFTALCLTHSCPRTSQLRVLHLHLVRLPLRRCKMLLSLSDMFWTVPQIVCLCHLWSALIQWFVSPYLYRFVRYLWLIYHVSVCLSSVYHFVFYKSLSDSLHFSSFVRILVIYYCSSLSVYVLCLLFSFSSQNWYYLFFRLLNSLWHLMFIH